MRILLGWFEAATRRPGHVLAALLAVTIALAGLASTNEFEVDLTQLGNEDSSAVQAMDRVREEFGDPTAAVQVILDAGPGGDMLTAEGLTAIGAAEDMALDRLGSAIRTGPDGQPQVLSLRSTVASALAQQGHDPDSAGDAQVGQITVRALAANPQLAALVSDDLDVGTGTARGTVVVLLLDPALTESERTDAGERVQAAFETDGDDLPADVRVTVFSSGVFVSGLLDAIRAEVPLLFGLALLVVLGILALAYRSVFDVAVGFAGLVATVVWTFGLVALLGPANLGWTGPLTQLAVIVPVLLVGLGVDYSVHLTARYREQRAAGQSPRVAAGRALRTVGAALVLATAATAVGFGSVAAAPLGMLADFGVFVAVGVVCAFVVMGLLVPTARVLRDRRQGDAEAVVRELGLGRLMSMPSRLAHRRPWAGMLVAASLMAVSLVAATGLEIEFDRDDFVPDGSDVQAVLAHQQDLFGGGVTESTFVVIDGELTDPAVANAVWEAQQDIADVEGVRAVGGTPQILSVMTLAAAALDGEAAALPGASGPAQDRESAAEFPPVGAWTGDGFSEDADLDVVYGLLRAAIGEQRVAQLLAPDASAAVVQIRTTAGDAGAGRIQREVESAFAQVEDAGATVTVTSEPIIIAEMSDELAAFQIRAIVVTLVVVLALLTVYYTLVRRRPLLGAIAMIPATISAALVLGTMWLLGISFNVLTATLTAIAVGIGVPYGVHLVNRFAEARDDSFVGEAITATLRSTGGALTGSALTTLGAFVVLAFSGLPPIRSLGLLGGAGIAFALLAAVLVEPGALVLWDRYHTARSQSAPVDPVGPPTHDVHPGPVVSEDGRRSS